MLGGEQEARGLQGAQTRVGVAGREPGSPATAAGVDGGLDVARRGGASVSCPLGQCWGEGWLRLGTHRDVGEQGEVGERGRGGGEVGTGRCPQQLRVQDINLVYCNLGPRS